MQIEIVSDTICPWCLIGKRRLEQALARQRDLDVEIVWKPFQLNPGMPAQGIPRTEYLDTKFGGAERAEEIYAAVRAAGTSENIPFDFDRIARVPNTVDSHRLIDWAGSQGKQDAVVEGLFQAYFIEGRDIGDRTVLAEVAAAAGMNEAHTARRLAGEEDRERIRAESAEAAQRGIHGVPFFVLDQKYAVSGAQGPEVFLDAFATLEREREPAAPALA